MRNLVLILLLAPTLAVAQHGFTFNRISTDDAIGLSSNIIYTTYQDNKGYIWTGTSNGLQRFDGNKFIRQGTRFPGYKLPTAELNEILPADSGKLWLNFATISEVGLFDPLTQRYERISFEAKSQIPQKPSMHLWRDSYGNVFLSIFRGPILRYNKKENKFIDDNYFGFAPGVKVQATVFEDTIKKQYWFIWESNGFLVYDVVTKKIFSHHYNPTNIPLLKRTEYFTNLTEFFIDKKRRYWVFNWTGQQHKRCYDEQGNSLSDTSGINANPEYSELQQFFETKNGILWIYGNNTLFSFDNKARRFHFYSGSQSQNGIQYQQVSDIMEDRDGGIWLSTDNGLYFTSPGGGTTQVINMLFDESKGAVEITDLLQLKSGEFLLSTWGQGIITLDKNFIQYQHDIYRNMPPVDRTSWIMYRQAWTLFQDADEKVWIGCQGGKYIVYDPKTKRSSFLTLDSAQNSTIRYITAGKNGNLFFATQRGYVIGFDGTSFTTLQKLNNIILKLFVDNEGLLWVVTANFGLYCLSEDGSQILKQYTAGTTGNSLFSNNGFDLDQLNDSILVFGAGALNLINKKTGKVTWKTFEEGLPGNSVRRIRKDGSGNLWVITLDGLCRYNPVTDHITQYGRKDGVTLANFTRTADLLSNNNLMMFVGGNAFLCFDPNAFENKQPPPDVTITDIRLFNDFISVDSLMKQEKIEFRPGENSFTIYFSPLSYAQKGRLTYYYKLEGIHNEWIRADNEELVNFSILPHGRYTFSIYAATIDGERSPNITTFSFRIRPYFWQTWWFVTLSVLVVVIAAYAFYRIRINKLLAIESLRTRVARDLHDDVGSTLSTINILGSMARTRVNVDPVKTTEYITKITENSQRMMEAMEDIVWSIKPDNDTMQKITVRMREFALSVLEAKDINVKLIVDPNVSTIRLNMEARRDLFLIFKEAINNAAKYSEAKNVTIHLGYHHRRLILMISDDGKGFDPSKADGNGLGNMEQRAALLKGRLQINTRLQQGTTVTLNIPVSHHRISE